MIIILAVFSFILVFLIIKLINKTRQEQKLLSILEGFLNNNININIDESLNSQVIMLLKNIQENQKFILESSLNDKKKLQAMISDLSHQLKTPLTNLKMYQTFLDEDDLCSKDIQKFKKKMRTQLAKIEWIVHSLINCMRLEEDAISFAAEVLPLNTTILDAIESVQISAELREINLKLSDKFKQEILVLHNYNWTREVFINVLENAIKYSPKNTCIFIDLIKSEIYTVLSIADQGIGIQKSEINRIFQRFYRGQDVKSIEGSGIGLYLSRLILEKENGYITVESIYKKGTTFKIWLPNP